MQGIYKITNIITNKLYIGSTNNLEKRRITHFSRLNKNIHSNKKLQYSYNKYGNENFKFEILETFNNIEKIDLLKIEQLYIDKYLPRDLFNILLITNSGGAEILKKKSILLDLEGNILKEYDSLSEIAKFLKITQVPSKSINTSSTIKLKYRIVTKEFYNKKFDLINSWNKYKVNPNKFNKYYQYDDKLQKWIVSYNIEIMGSFNTETEALKVSKQLHKLIMKNLI